MKTRNEKFKLVEEWWVDPDIAPKYKWLELTRIVNQILEVIPEMKENNEEDKK